jgi:hypothetical protein
VHQHRSPAALFTLYFCECGDAGCDLKVALTADEFGKLAGNRGSHVGHPRCATAAGRSRFLPWRRRNAR